MNSFVPIPEVKLKNPDYEYFKVLVLANSQETSKEIAKWVIGCDEIWRSYFTNEYILPQFLSYSRWVNCPEDLPNTVYVDAMVVYADSQDEFKSLESLISRHSRIVQIVFLTKQDDMLTETSSTLGCKSFNITKCSDKEVRAHLLEREEEFINRAKQVYSILESKQICSDEEVEKEFLHLSNTISSNTTTLHLPEIKACINRLRDFKGLVHFDSFVKWLKMGRQHDYALKAMADLEKLFTLLDEHFFSKFRTTKDENNYTNYKSNLTFYDTCDRVTRSHTNYFDFSLVFSGTRKLDIVKDYLSQRTKNMNSAIFTWIDLDLGFSEDVTGEEAKALMNSLKDALGELMEERSELKEIFRTFFGWETYANVNSAKLTLRLKIDAEVLFLNALRPIVNFAKILKEKATQEISFCFYSVNRPSGVSGDTLFQRFLECFKSQFILNLTTKLGSELLKQGLKSLLEFNSNAISNNLASILNLLSLSDSLEMTMRTDFPDLANFFKVGDGVLGNFINVFQSLIEVRLDKVLANYPELVKKCKRVQLALNIFDFFAHFSYTP